MSKGIRRLMNSTLACAAVLIANMASAQTPTGAAVPTFTKDVAPILNKSCVVCHRPGSIAPMSLTTYEDARPWARSIKTKISQREMPPWFIERNVGIQKFKDDPSLSDEQIATIVKWIDGGEQKGNPADMQEAPAFENASDWKR